jgi:SAM-dependent methyltransferase
VRLDKINYTQLCLLTALCIGGLAFVAHGLIKHPTPVNIVVLAVFAYVALRLIHEYAFNRHGVPLVASGFFVRRKFATLLRKNLPPPGPYTVLDFGSGRGELTRAIARALPYAQVTGIESAFFPYRQSMLLGRLSRLKNLDYRRLDFWSCDCSKVDAVVMYLSGKLTKEIGEKLHRELKPGALVITYTFALLGEWAVEEVITFRSPFKETLYVYRQRATP